MDDALPKIGAPATRALASIGVTRLSQLTKHRTVRILVLALSSGEDTNVQSVSVLTANFKLLREWA